MTRARISLLALAGIALLAGCMGPATPDDETDLGETPEAHDELSPHDLPKDHPGRQAAEELAGGEGGTTSGNV